MRSNSRLSLTGRLLQIVRRMGKAAEEPVCPTPAGRFLYVKMHNDLDEPAIKFYNAYEYKDYFKKAGFVFDGQAWIGTPEMLAKIDNDAMERIIASINRQSILDTALSMADYISNIRNKK